MLRDPDGANGPERLKEGASLRNARLSERNLPHFE